MKTNGFTALFSLLLTVNQEFSKTEDVIFGAPSPSIESPWIYTFTEKLCILVLGNHCSRVSITSLLPGVLSDGNLRKFSLLFTLGVMTAANLECSDVEWI